jgi:hypothetical protein
MKRPSLRNDWKHILKHAYSVRLIVLAGALSGAEVALPIIQPYVPIWPGALAAGAGLAACGAFFARIAAQKQFGGGVHGA